MARVLLIDDSRVVREKLKLILNQEGHEIIGEASDGSQGVVLYQLLKPDVVTVDISMPGMDGYEVIGKLKQIDAQVKIVVISGNGEKHEIARALSEGAKEFILKPFDRASVSRVLKSIV